MSFYVICVCLRIVVSNPYCVMFFVLFVFIVCPMLPVSLHCPFLIAPLVSLTFIYSINIGTRPLNLLTLLFKKNDKSNGTIIIILQSLFILSLFQR